MTPERLREIEGLCNAATKGPWESDTVKSEGSYGSGEDTYEGYNAYAMHEPGGKTLFNSLDSDFGEVQVEYGGDENGDYADAWDEVARRNFAFIAVARTAVPDLIAAIRSLTPTWTHEVPTVEGWWWYEHPGDDEFKDATQICNVVAIDDVRLFVWFIGEFTDGPVLIETLRGRWSDKPMPMPVEPEGGR